MAKIENTLPPVLTDGTSIHNNLSGLNDGEYIHLTTIEKNKFDNLPDTFAPVDAEKNVNTDWNSVSGDSQLLNKPLTFPPSSHTHVEADITDLDKYTQVEVDNLLNDKFDNPVGNNTQYLDGAGLPTIFPTIPSISGLATETYVNNGLANKVDKNTTITGATKTKVTYDSKGLVTNGADATTADIADSTNKRYVTDSEKTAITHSNRSILDAITESFTTALKTAYDNAVSWITTNGTNVLNHLSNVSNPHNVTKSQVGLGNVDNTSDINKPISTATQTALNLKQNALTNPITGTGTLTKIPKFTGAGTLGDSIISDDGSGVVDVGTNGTINTRLRAFSSVLNSYFEIRSAGSFGGINSYGLSNFQMYNTLNSTGYFSWFTQTGATPVERMRLTNDGNLLVNTTTNNGVDKIQVNGTISASPATTSNQVVVKSQLDAKKDTAIIVCSHTVQTFADSTSYFFGINVGFNATTSTNLARRFEAPFTGNIIDFYVKCISQTVTSSEDVVLKINNKTTGLSYTVGNVRYNNVVFSYLFNGFTIPVTKNDSLEFEIVVPVLANNGLNSLTIVNAVFEKS